MTEADAAAEQLLLEHQKLACYIAHRFCRRYEFLDLDDAMQIARIALWHAAKRFLNATAACKASTFLGKQVEWALIRHIHEVKEAYPDPHVKYLSEPFGEDGTLVDFCERKLMRDAESQRIDSERQALLVDKVLAAMEAANLTERERRFCVEYVSGGSMESIAQNNNISRMRVSQVVGDAVRKIRKKMGVTSKPAASVTA